MNYKKDSNRRNQESIKSVSKKTSHKISLSFTKIIVFSILLLLIIGTSSVLGVAKAIVDSAPELTSYEQVFPEGYATKIYDQNGNEVQTLHGEDANRIYIEIDQVPEDFKNAVVAIEDERFYQHNGIDMEGIFRAIFENIKSNDPTGQGASTITQQIIKNNMLSTEQTYERKIQEQYLALQLEKMIDKSQILELYVNTAPYGRGTLGVQSAANTYFNKDASELTLAECAVIAGITQYPTKYDPVANPESNRERQVIVLQKLLDQDYITQEEYDEAYDEDVYAHIQIVTQEIADQSDYSYFVDEVIRNVAEDLEVEKGYTSTQAYNLIYSGGLSIYITQDAEMQAVVDNVFTGDEYFPPESDCYAVRLMYSLSVQTDDGPVHHYEEVQFDTNEEAEAHIEELKIEWEATEDNILAETALFIPQPQSAMIIMDYHTGYVKAMTGGRGEKIGNQVFNRATQALRQPGSTFKVLAAYLPAIDEFGYTLGTVIDDVPFTVNMGTGATYQPSNWYRNWTYDYRGLSTVREAIQNSMNVCAVKTIYDIGTEAAYEYLLDLGFTTLCDNEEINGSYYTDKTLALALGGVTKGVTLVELNAAYGAIANEGVYIEPIFYTRVLNHDNAILLNNEPTTRTVMKETTSFLLTSALKSVVSSGTGTPAYFEGMPIAGKTGTTSDNIDYVFCGFTPYYVASVWMGYDQPESMPSLSYHKKIWKVVMEEIHADLEYKDFTKPSGIVGATICTESGKLATEICSNDPRGATTRYEYFASGTVPTESCDVHITANVCAESGLIATEYCPEETVTEQVFIVRPEPLIPEEWDPADPPRIADYQYEFPVSMEGEYCNIHGPMFELPEVTLPGEETDDPSINIDTDDTLDQETSETPDNTDPTVND